MDNRSLALRSNSQELLLGTAQIVLLACLGIAIVRAEEHNCWPRAQACVVAIMALSWIVGWAWWKKRPTPDSWPTEAAAYFRVIRKLMFCVAIGFTAVLLNANRLDRWQYGLVAKSMGYGTLISGAAFICGVMLGFLFGFRPTNVAHPPSDQPSGTRLHPPTNLEEIADWLTKIILGAGLVELTRMRGPILQLSKFIAKGVNPETQNVVDSGSAPIALAIMVFFFASGVLYGFLWTRFESSLALDGLCGDATALAMTDRWFNQPAIANDQTRLGMMNAIKSASLATQVRIFFRAEQYRRPSTEDTNARSLPVFQALVEADLQEVFHRNRAQYALALMGQSKDPSHPKDNWTYALRLLNNAIQIRDSHGEKGWPEYELARAVCQIHLDPAQKQAISADLDKLKDGVSEALMKDVDQDDVIAGWRRENQSGI